MRGRAPELPSPAEELLPGGRRTSNSGRIEQLEILLGSEKHRDLIVTMARTLLGNTKQMNERRVDRATEMRRKKRKGAGSQEILDQVEPAKRAAMQT